MKRNIRFPTFLLIILLITCTIQSISFAQNVRSTHHLDISSLTLRPTRTHYSFPLLPLPLFNENVNNDPEDPFFTPSDAALSDDAFHNSNELQYTEWWYFDADFGNNLSLQFSIHVYNILKMSFIMVNYNVYQSGASIVSQRTMYPSSDVQISSHEPFISLSDDRLQMIGYLGPDQQTMHYHISYMVDDSSMDLYYRGTTKAWKGTTPAGDWAVILPRAYVSGSLMINNSKIKVFGIGYHDHNWNVTSSAGINFGWIWGKTSSDTFTLTWATILTTWFKGNPILVVNKEYDGYYSIPSYDLSFKITDISFKDGMIIPYGFRLEGYTDNITIDLYISVLQTDYTTIGGFVNYWRYHVHSKGTITFNNNTEPIDDYGIAEFIRFRFY